MQTHNKTRLSVLLIIFGLSCLTTNAQRKLWHDIQGHSLTKLDWNCATVSTYSKLTIEPQVRALLKTERLPESTPDRAFAFDLNHDRKPEYFVPLDCGAVGNCTWGIFTLQPERFLGTVNGQYLFVHSRANRWPTILAYGHLSAVEGNLITYLFKRRRYRLAGKGIAIGPTDRTLDIQNVQGRSMPKFLNKAHSGYQDLGS